MKYFFHSILLCMAAILISTSLEAAYVLKNNKLINSKYMASLPVHEHFSLGVTAFQNQEWGQAIAQFQTIALNFPNSTFAHDAHYYLGMAYYHTHEYEFANQELDKYLKVRSNPEHFEEVMKCKYLIAEKFKEGARRRLFGWEQMPKLTSANTLALTIYDQVIAALPSHDIAAKSLYSKAQILLMQCRYRESEEALQALVKRFPRHELAPEGYLALAKLYCERCEAEFQNPDLIALANINLRKFRDHSPGDERLQEVEATIRYIKEAYARGLYNTGRYYERVNHPQASTLYYYSALSQFPDTSIAAHCQARLNSLHSHAKELGLEGYEEIVSTGERKADIR